MKIEVHSVRIFADEIRELLNNNDFHFVDVNSDGNDCCSIYMYMGDWKHDHVRLKNLLTNAGYYYDIEIEDDDCYDDCFSAIYYVMR